MSTLALESHLSAPPGFWSELFAAYRTPPRVYHSIDHVVAVAFHYRDVADDVGWNQPREVFLAVLFHDAVYRVGDPDNESASARLARASMERWLPDDGIQASRVVQLIELTARHGSLSARQVDPEAALFLDCDMAILGADPPAYQAYSRAVAKEIGASIPRAAYRTGRSAFLQRLLAAPRIFLSDYFHARLDSAARHNLEAELDALSA